MENIWKISFAKVCWCLTQTHMQKVKVKKGHLANENYHDSQLNSEQKNSLGIIIGYKTWKSKQQERCIKAERL